MRKKNHIIVISYVVLTAITICISVFSPYPIIDIISGIICFVLGFLTEKQFCMYREVIENG